MKKLILGVALMLSVATFAQKDELKTLKKLYSRENLNEKDIALYKSTIASLESIASEKSDKVYLNFYKGMLPLIEIMSLGDKVTPADQMRVFNPKALDDLSNSLVATIDFEKESGKQIYTKDIEETLSWFKPMLSQFAFQLNSNSKFKEGSELFYNIYKLDKNDGSNLENAAILAVQAQDYVQAEKYYREFFNSDYINKHINYFAINKASGQEESFPSRESRMKSIGLGIHEKPREEKLSVKKPEISKTIAVLSFQNGNIEQAKKDYKLAKELNPDDIEVLSNEANVYYQSNDLVSYEKLVKELILKDPTNASLHFNIGYLSLSEDQKIVDELNKNTSNNKLYNELMEKRKAIFRNALPHFEKSYSLDSSNDNTKQLLRLTYEVLGMKDKAATIK
jgi:tetratricopeptide (TPR) repeat protein